MRLAVVEKAAIRSRPLASTFYRFAAEALVTVAQFMPMKSLFILAAGVVPEFFPRFLVDSGPIGASLALISGAGLLAILSRVLLRASDMSAPADSRLLQDVADKGRWAPTLSLITTLRAANFLLFLLLCGVISWVSPLLAVLGLAWLASSALVFALWAKLGQRTPPYVSGKQEFIVRFDTFLTNSALWSSVIFASIALLFSSPPLGLTGILISAVFLVRAQLALRLVLPIATSLLVIRRPEPGVTLKDLAFNEGPWEYFSTKAGANSGRKFLSTQGIDNYEASIVGQPQKHQITLSLRPPGVDSETLVRVFSNRHRQLRDRELLLRKIAKGAPLFSTEGFRSRDFLRFPAIFITADSPLNRESTRIASPEQLARMQLEWERFCLISPEIQGLCRAEVAPHWGFPIFETLGALCEFVLPKESSAHTVLKRLDQVERSWGAGGFVVHFGSELSSSNLVHTEKETVMVLDTSNWGVGLLGAHWGATDAFPNLAREILNSTKGLNFSLRDLTIRHRTTLLERAIAQRNLPQLELASRKLLEYL